MVVRKKIHTHTYKSVYMSDVYAYVSGRRYRCVTIHLLFTRVHPHETLLCFLFPLPLDYLLMMMSPIRAYTDLR